MTKTATTRVWGAGAIMAAALSAAPALATQVQFPKADPQVSLDVPDGWTVQYTKTGLELRSPESDSTVIANLMKRDKAAVDAWSKSASDRLIADGVSFKKDAAPPPAAKLPADKGSDFAFSGAPSLETPKAAPETGATAPGKTPEKVGPAPKTINDLPYHVVQYYGASFKEKPVDVQLVVFNLPQNRVFLLEQQSRSDDGRAVGIVMSVKALH